jgi:hypothetical protein
LPKPVNVALADLSAAQVTGYVVEYCRGWNAESAKALVVEVEAAIRCADGGLHQIPQKRVFPRRGDIGGYSHLTVVACLVNGFTPRVGRRW